MVIGASHNYVPFASTGFPADSEILMELSSELPSLQIQVPSELTLNRPSWIPGKDTHFRL
ncbi:MAG TPA: hypothetical protein DEA96_03940 [Leptospiraceae bacterium]|nr:hypothetical protein [Spirochaetaceae bacterium]HBS04092.1 hypothetical protein [Leptospiraceae bacterium]